MLKQWAPWHLGWQVARFNQWMTQELEEGRMRTMMARRTSRCMRARRRASTPGEEGLGPPRPREPRGSAGPWLPHGVGQPPSGGLPGSGAPGRLRGWYSSHRVHTRVVSDREPTESQRRWGTRRPARGSPAKMRTRPKWRTAMRPRRTRRTMRPPTTGRPRPEGSGRQGQKKGTTHLHQIPPPWGASPSAPGLAVASPGGRRGGPRPRRDRSGTGGAWAPRAWAHPLARG